MDAQVVTGRLLTRRGKAAGEKKDRDRGKERANSDWFDAW